MMMVTRLAAVSGFVLYDGPRYMSVTWRCVSQLGFFSTKWFCTKLFFLARKRNIHELDENINETMSRFLYLHSIL